MFLWGDHLGDDEMWRAEYASTRRFHDALLAAGGDSAWLDLPALGITGNSHLLMMDDNSAQIADLVCDWIRGKDHIAK